MRTMALSRTGNRVVRPADFADVYSNPYPEFSRLAERGVLVKVAAGRYLVVPDDQRGRSWHPGVEAVALGLAIADYGRDEVTLTGPSAARALGAIPRALATAVVAVPKQRPPITTRFGSVIFVTRNARALDRQRIDTAVVTGWTTTPEQTVLDLADRPTLGGISGATAAEAIGALVPHVDRALVDQLARAQRKPAARRRLQWVAQWQPDPPGRRPVPTRGLTSAADPADYGLTATPS